MILINWLKMNQVWYLRTACTVSHIEILCIYGLSFVPSWRNRTLPPAPPPPSPRSPPWTPGQTSPSWQWWSTRCTRKCVRWAYADLRHSWRIWWRSGGGCWWRCQWWHHWREEGGLEKWESLEIMLYLHLYSVYRLTSNWHLRVSMNIKTQLSTNVETEVTFKT